MPNATTIIRRRKARRRRQQQRRTFRRTVWLVLVVLIVVPVVLPASAALLVGLRFYNATAQRLPDPQTTIYLDPIIGTTQFYDRTDQTLIWSIADPLGDEREWVTLDTLPAYLIDATVLREDPDYLDSRQFSPQRVAQQLVANAVAGPVRADPTLSGRLVRNVIAPPPDVVTATYRAEEIALVAEINRLYTPEQRLEWYLNTAYYGNSAYGVDAAARIYFDKRAADLTLDEAALLAAIPPAPQYNPIDDIVATRSRQADTLRDLLVDGRIAQADYNAATATLTLIQPDAAPAPTLAPDFTRTARAQAEDILDALGYDGSRMVARGGLRVVTTLDLGLHNEMRCTLDAHLEQLATGRIPAAPDCVGASYLTEVGGLSGALPDSGAVVALDVNTGELLAGVGDIAAQTRQPAPLLRPFVYLQGFTSALYTPATMLLDIPQQFPGVADGLVYMPTNPGSAFYGPLSLRDAMGAGLLPPAVQVANAVGLDNMLRNARIIGMNGLERAPYDLSLLERGGGISVLDAAYAYSVFGGLGQMRGVPAQQTERISRPYEPAAVLRITSATGETLWEYNPSANTVPLLEPGLAYLVNDILADPATRVDRAANGSLLAANRPTAVVFGRSSNARDAWTVGYSPNLALAVWVGRTDEAPVTDGDGRLSAPLWRALIELSHDRYGLGADEWERPPNIIDVRVCERSGLRVSDDCPVRTEIFLANTEPQEADTFWQRLTVNNQTGQLATANTPANFREEKLFFVPPDEALDWWTLNQLPLPPDEFDTLTRPELVQSTVILRPELLAYVRGVVDVRGSMETESLQYYQVAYGQGLNPSAWVDISGQQTTYTPGQVLAEWDTTNLDGLYNLRLTAVLNDNSIDPYIVQVTVDNVPPAVTLQAGETGQVFTLLADDTVPLVADATDNVAIDRVEFYTNGEFVGTDETYPFGYNHPIEAVGPLTFNAVVFDAAGNQASSELQIDIQRGGT